MAAETTRVKDIPTTAPTAAADDYVLLDGATNGTRKGLASNLITSAAAAAAVAWLKTTINYSYPWLQNTSVVSGSGSTTLVPHFLYVSSGATANSKAKGQAASGYQAPITSGSTSTGMNMDAPFTIEVPVVIISAIEEGVSIFGFGLADADAAGPLASKGWSFEIRYKRVWLVVHDGSTLLEADSGIDLVIASATPVAISRTSAGFDLYISGAKSASVACGALGKDSSGLGLYACTQNGASGGNNSFRVGIPQIYS